jgi:hypothetical protein
MNAEAFLADVESTPTPSAEDFLTDAPSAESFLDDGPGAIAGTINEFKRGLLRGQQTIVAGELERAPKAPKMRQLRQAYVKAMDDPRYQNALNAAGNDPVKLKRVEDTLGPTAQVGRVESAIRLNRQFIAEDVAKLEAEAAAIPASEAMQEWGTADNSNWAKVLAKNPVEITAGIMAQSFPAMAPALAATMVTPGARVNRMMTAGAGSYSVESANAFLDSARETGYDFTDAAQVQAFFENPEAQAKARAHAVKRGIPIAVFDAATLGLAGKFIAPALREPAKRTVGQVLGRTGAEISTQMVGGAGGEATAQVVSGQPISAKEIVAEALGELGSGPVEAYRNLKGVSSQRSVISDQPGQQGRPVDDELPPGPTEPTASAEEFLSAPGQSDVPLQGEAATGVDTTKNVPAADGRKGSGVEPTPATPPEQSGGSIARAANVVAAVYDRRPGQIGGDTPPLQTQTSVPEDPRTIAAQMQMLVDGKRSAVLITEGEAMPEVPGNFKTVELEGYGTMIYSPRVHKEESIIARAKEDKLGRILGYGVERKPAAGTEVGVVTVRSPEGVEKQAVVTDQKNLEDVTKAAEQVASPQDTVQLETAESVIEGRQGSTARAASSPVAARPELPQVTEAHLQQAREAVAQMRGESAERAPDILDDLDPVTRGPIRVPAELNDVIDASRERLAEALHNKPWKRLSSAQRKKINGALRVTTEGDAMAADQVVPGLGDKWAGISVDDLTNAVLDAAEGRLLQTRKEDSAEVKQMAQEMAAAENAEGGMQNAEVTDFDQAAAEVQKDAIESALDQAIAATDLNRGQTLEGITGAPVWLTKAALNGLLRIVRATYRGTKNLAQALQAGIEWLRAQNLPNFSETEIKTWLAANVTVTPNDDDINIREFTDQLDADQPLPPDPARMVGNLLYDRRTNESDAAFAARVMQAVGGPAQAADVFRDATNGLPGSVRMFLGQLIIKAYGVMGQHEQAARFYDETFAGHVTETAQALQSLSAFLALTPEGKLIWAQKKIQRAANALVEPVEPQLTAAKQELDAANAAGIEATTAAPDVQEAARQAVDAALEKQAQTPGTELQEAIRAEVLDQLVKAGLLTAREAEIYRLHLEGTADNSTLAQKLERAGIPMHDKRAEAINQLYKAKTKTEREKIKSRARAARKTAQKAAEGNEDAIDAAIKRAMKELRVQLGQVIRKHHTKAEAVGQSLADKIAAASGLSEADAKKLAEAVAKRFAAIVTGRKKAALEKLLKPVKRIAKPALVEQLVQRSNQGALSNEQFWNAVRANLDLPAWSNELAERIRAQVDVVERIPEDQIERKQKAQVDLLNLVERAKGLDGFDLGLAFYITNILTGITTHLKNIGSTFLNASGAIGSEAVRAVASGRLDDIPLMLEAIGQGMKRGKLAAGDVLRTGVVTGSRLTKLEPGRALELTQFGKRGGVPVRGTISKAILENRLAGILNLWKYNFRIMAAEDMIFFKPAEEAKAALLAKRIARSEGQQGAAANDRARQILGYGYKAVQSAQAQATAEGVTGPALARRTAEILNANRPLEVREDARQFALRTTFNNDPYGALGFVAHLLNQAKASPNKKVRFAANLITPFTNIIANVVNESLNYTPVGVLRARYSGNELLGYQKSKLSVQQQADLKAELYAKALVGTTLLTSLALYAAGSLDDEDPEFAIYGAGPAQATDRQGLEAKQWIAHSIKVGDRYYSYANTPVAIPMAWLGGIMDRIRDARLFGNRSAQRTAESLPLMAASSAVGMAKVVTEQSFMVGAMDVLRMIGEPSPETGGRQLLKQSVRIATSSVIPNAVRQVDKFFDPAQYEQRSAEGILVNAIPFVRGAAGQPSLNALGLPITRPLASQFTSSQADVPPLVQYLAESGNWPTLPNRNEIYPRTGRTMTEAEYYEYVKGSGTLAYNRLEKLRSTGALARYKDDQIRAKVVAEYFSGARAQWRAQNGW